MASWRGKNTWRGLAFLFAALATIAVIFTAAGCITLGPSEEQGGSGSEIVGNVEYSDTSADTQAACLSQGGAIRFPVVLGNVFCYTRTFIPDTSWAAHGASPRVFTDSMGFFHLFDVPRGDVVVEANNGNGWGIVKTITIDRDSSRFDIGTLTVAKTGGVSIQAHSQLPGNVRFYMSVKGTRCIIRGSKTDMAVVLENIPTGIPHTVNIRVFEPIPMELNFSGITIPEGGVRMLDDFEIK